MISLPNYGEFGYVSIVMKVPPVLEITLVPKTDVSSQYPGLYLFSTPARMIRPVFNLHHDKVEWIGTFEQVYMHVAIKAEDVNLKVTFFTFQGKCDIFKQMLRIHDCSFSSHTIVFCSNIY